MREIEYTLQQARIKKYEELWKLRKQFAETLQILRTNKAFSGNTSETLRVENLSIGFSPQLAGGEPLQLELTQGLHFPGFYFGIWMQDQIKATLARIDEELEKL